MKPAILVVDDDVTICALLEDVLSEHVFAVTTCHTGQAALRCIETQPDIALVLLDMVLPDTNGLMDTTVTPDGQNQFQGRYAILHPWTGAVVDVMHVANDPVNMRPFFERDAQGTAMRLPGRIEGERVFMPSEIPLFYTNPLRAAMSSATMDTAISSGVSAPISRPMGLWTRPKSSSEKPSERRKL